MACPGSRRWTSSLKVRGLDKRLDNNILLLVAPADEIAAREKQQMESRNQVADPLPYTEYLQINHAKASEVAACSSERTKLLSPEGAVSVDERTNVLVVKDTADVIQQRQADAGYPRYPGQAGGDRGAHGDH